MSREEMLKHLGVTGPELHEFIQKFHAFLATLDQAERALISRSLPTMQQALAAFGPDVSADDLVRLFEGDEHSQPVVLCFPLGNLKNR